MACVQVCVDFDYTLQVGSDNMGIVVFGLIDDNLPVFMWRSGSRLEEIKKFTAEAPINSASLHPCEKFFVAGGEDFKMYKFDYETGKEIGEFRLSNVSFRIRPPFEKGNRLSYLIQVLCGMQEWNVIKMLLLCPTMLLLLAMVIPLLPLHQFAQSSFIS